MKCRYARSEETCRWRHFAGRIGVTRRRLAGARSSGRCSMFSTRLSKLASLGGFALLAIGAASGTAQGQTTPAGDKIPITTSSEEARKLFVQGRDLAEKLRATDARKFYEQAVAKDK